MQAKMKFLDKYMFFGTVGGINNDTNEATAN
jgi:hypothetical protein